MRLSEQRPKSDGSCLSRYFQHLLTVVNLSITGVPVNNGRQDCCPAGATREKPFQV